MNNPLVVVGINTRQTFFSSFSSFTPWPWWLWKGKEDFTVGRPSTAATSLLGPSLVWLTYLPQSLFYTRRSWRERERVCVCRECREGGRHHCCRNSIRRCHCLHLQWGMGMREHRFRVAWEEWLVRVEVESGLGVSDA